MSLYVLYKLCTGTKLFKHLRNRYNKQQLKLLNEVQKSRRKLQNLFLQNKFLRKCIENKVVPSFIQSRIERSKLKCSPAVERTFMADEIAKNISVSQHVKPKYKSNLELASEWLSELDKLKFLRYLVVVDRKTKTKKLAKHDKTIQFLRSKRFGNYDPASSSVLNLSSYVPSSSESFVLGLGLKHSVPKRNLQREVVFSEFESLSGQLFHHKPKSVEALEGLNAKLYDLAHSFCGTPLDLSDFRMRKECFEAYKSIKDNNDIIITRPDKGSGVVILNRTDYVNKMIDIISDVSKFKQLGHADQVDFTAKIEKAFQNRMYKWLKDGSITAEVYNLIRPTGSQRPRLYGLPKTHKPNCPLRPILSMIGSPQHKLAKYLIAVLKPVLDKFSRYTVKDSFSFVESLRSLPSASFHMCSFDIKSLFTNVPLLETIRICLNQLYHSDLTPPDVAESVCFDMLKMATVNVEFSFDNIMYRQVDGVAMGSPLGPILANIFVGFYEEQLFRSGKQPSMYLRYVDDTFVLFDERKEGEEFLERLNNLHNALQFTKEDENNGKLAFLDVFIERSAGAFLTSVYRKPTFNGDYIPWSSFCPTKRKTGLISCLVKRAIKICSPGKLEEEMHKLTSIFLNLGYPEFVVKRTIKQTMERDRDKPTIGPKKCPVYIRLPFIGPVSSRFESQLKDGVSKTFGSVSLRVVFHSNKLFQRVPKDGTPTNEKNNVIYNFRCHCESEYVGRTSKRFHLRRDEHVPNNIRKWMTDQDRSRPSASYFTAIGQHLLSHPECAKNYSDDRFKILARGRNQFHLQTLESLFIQTKKPVLCKQKKYVYQTKIFKMLL